MKKALIKDSFIQIKKTNKRFISILLMAFLGVGFFAGVRATSPDMKITVDNYFDTMNVYDLKIVSTLGLTEEDKTEVSKIEGVKDAYGLYSEDVFLKIKDEENVVKVLEYESKINKPDLVEGKFPEKSDECLIEYYMSEYEGVKIDDVIEIEEKLEDDEEASFKNTKLKVVGIAKSPVYISRDRGTTSLGTGKIDYFIYVSKENIDSDIYTEIDLIADGAFELNTINKEYDDLTIELKKKIETIKDERQKARYTELVDEANKKLSDSEKELNEKKADGEKQISDAEKKISDAKRKIVDGEKKIQDSEKELQEGKNTAAVEFANADAEISSNETKLAEARIALTDAENLLKAKKQEAEEGINQINSGISEIDKSLASLNESKSLAEGVLSSLKKIDSTINTLTQTLNQYNEELISNPSNQELLNMIDYINGQIQTLSVQKNELLSYGITEEKLNQINSGIAECNSKKQELQNQLNVINQGLAEGQRQIDEGNNNLYFANEQLAVRKSRT